jgi:shikimate kinase
LQRSELIGKLPLISLIGMPGGGKSTVARHLAKRLNLALVDSDHVIEERIGEPIRSFFEREGEESFRDVEQAVIADITSSFRGVLATGGGSVLRAANREMLRRCSTVLYLNTSPEALFRRLRFDNKRPLLRVEDPLQRLRDLHAVRDPLYLETAHFVVATGRSAIPTLVSTILTQLELGGIIDPCSVPSVIDPSP